MMIQALSQTAHAGIATLRTLNPYVGAALGEWSRTPGLQPSVPRQLAPAAQLRPGAAAGASSFGMSGTNAHMLASAEHPAQQGARQPAWQRSRCALLRACYALWLCLQAPSAGEVAGNCLGQPAGYQIYRRMVESHKPDTHTSIMLTLLFGPQPVAAMCVSESEKLQTSVLRC